MYAVRLRELTKDFSVGFWRPRPYRALDRVTLDVEPGEVLGYLGPNGSGKTTTLKLLMQLLFPTSGSAEILGRPAGDLDVRRRVGFLPESPYFYDNLTANELLRYFARLFGLDYAEAKRKASVALDRVGIGVEREMRLRRYSKGMLQRVGIAQALINDPDVLFLDEPMSGLDPVGRREVRDLILALRDEGKTLFFSSHILTDAAALCSRVAVLAEGKLVACGSIADLELKVRGWELVVADVAPEKLSALALSVGEVTRVDEGRYVINLPVHRRPEPIVTELAEQGARIVSLNPNHETLEEFFLSRVTGPPHEERRRV
jgi:ABC-2 type transport system ATP-binding protein